ncbi:DinB family protein [Microbacterium sp. ARD31]|uniref:DinB family protein n=1 Tax=Microbacterium sp. ARD31 TaxID=2962576 RepID=UPI0028816535|nr:DinB family protein [Microbacterium sp. ARD31]MDT0186544.1 DinB family protein [Microbacterium sp. ARD31]
MTIERPEPSFSNDEVGMLRSFLDHYRATIRLQASGLSDAQLDQPLPPSDLTLGGMLKHLAYVEDWWFSYHLAAQDPSPPWDTAPWDDDEDWDWHSASGQGHAELDALLVAAIRRSDACLDAALAADPDLGRPVARPRPPEKGETATLRWVLVHMVEEYARHAGHADLIRQSIDGATDV